PHFVDGPEDASLSPNYLELGSTIDGLPLVIIVIDRDGLFDFYRDNVQTLTTGLHTPTLDWSKWVLVHAHTSYSHDGIYNERGKELTAIKSPSCRRDFENRQTQLQFSVGSERGPGWSWPKTSFCIVQYQLHVNDLPLKMNV